MTVAACSSKDNANNTMNVDENLTTTDMNATDMNATDMNAGDMNADMEAPQASPENPDNRLTDVGGGNKTPR